MKGKSRLYGRAILAEWRSAPGRLTFFIICLAIGVAAVLAVATHASALDRAIRREARQLLAADLAVSGSRPVPTEVAGALTAEGARVAVTRELVTIVTTENGGSSLLVELKSADPGYPFYGRLETTPARSISDLGEDGVLVAPDLLARLGVAVGDRLRIGGEPFSISGTIDREPDRTASGFTLGPRVLVSTAGLARTDLERFGSRISYKLLVALPSSFSEAEREATADRLREQVDDTRFRVETYADAQPALRRAISRATRFVGLVALLSLLLGGVGIAYTLQAWLAERIDDIAVLRCLGWRPRQIVTLFSLQAGLLGVAGSLVGGALGMAAASVLPRLAGDLLPVRELALWQPTALGRGLLLGVGTALLFTLAPVLSVRSVPPLRVLRRDVEPIPMSWWLRSGIGLLLFAGIWSAASLQSDSWSRGLAFTAGLGLAIVALALVTRVALAATRPLARRIKATTLRQGLLAVARPGAAAVSACVALGLGILLVLGIRLVEIGLTEALTTQVPGSAPNLFMVDIQPEQWPEVQQILGKHGAGGVDSVPVVSARLQAVDSITVEALVEEAGNGDRRWGLTREQRLTYLESLPEDNRLVAGELWGDEQRAEASLEQDFARDIGVGLGSLLTFEIQGVPIEAAVTSLRTVEWRTFGLNFFIVVEPGVLEAAPQTRVATVQLAASREQGLQDEIARRFPNITILPIRSILARIAAVLARLALGVRFLGGFTVLAGVAILASAVSAAATRRARETALLKTLGMTRREVILQSATEHCFIGLIAATVGAGGGNVLAWAVLTRGMDLAWSFQPGITFTAVALGIGLTVATSLAAGRRALTVPPMAVLRDR